MSIEARAAMTRDVLTVGPDETVSAVSRKMAQRAVSAVPVVDEGGKVVGMLSEGDILRRFGAEHQRRRAWWLNQIAEGMKLAPEFLDYVSLDHQRVKDLMNAPVITATEDTPLSHIVDLMVIHKVKRIAIVTDGKLAGIVSRADVVRRIVESPDDVLDAIVNPN